MSDPKLNADERSVLRALASTFCDYGGFGFLGFAAISRRAKMDRARTRRACRSLARKGLAEFQRGLWTDDGHPGGSGYGATKAGAALVERPLSRRQRAFIKAVRNAEASAA